MDKWRDRMQRYETLGYNSSGQVRPEHLSSKLDPRKLSPNPLASNLFDPAKSHRQTPMCLGIGLSDLTGSNLYLALFVLTVEVNVRTGSNISAVIYSIPLLHLCPDISVIFPSSKLAVTLQPFGQTIHVTVLFTIVSSPS